jgi:ribosomal-protein-alanine N-acetyltransferase
MDFIVSLFRMPPARAHPPLQMQLTGPRVMLRMYEAEDWQMWHALRELSRDYLIPWEPEWPPYALTYGHYCSLLRRQWRDWRGGKGYAFGIFLRDGQHQVLIGGITLGEVQYAASQKGTLGYWIGRPYAGQGYATEAVGLVCDFAFTQVNLQRVEASCLPRNEASKTVLTRCGFGQEGLAKAYMQINGRREDHLLWGKNATGPKKQTVVSASDEQAL